MLNVEHNLLSEPLRRAPNEFSGMLDEFEIMEKYQHYGLCTRLLDITTNPLVALYFACLPHGEEEYLILNEDNSSGEELEKIKQESYGVVYFREALSPIPSDDIKTKIIISLTKMDLDEKNIKLVLESLFLKQIIFEDQKKKWQSEDGFTKEELENIVLSVTGETNSLEEIVNVIDEIRKQTDWYKKESIIS